MQHEGFEEWMKTAEDPKFINGQEYMKIVRQRPIDGVESEYVQTLSLVTVHPEYPQFI